MKKSRMTLQKLLVILFMLALFVVTPVLATESALPLLSKDQINQIADKDTMFITHFSQDPLSKVIAATVVVKNDNHGSDATTNIINGVGIEISFSSKVAPYNYSASQSYNGGLNFSNTDFNKYCDTLTAGFDVIGSTAMCNDSSYRFIGGTISSSNNNNRLEIAPGGTAEIARFYFMPQNGEALDLEMFSYQILNYSQLPDLGLIKLATWFGYGTNFLVPNKSIVIESDTYCINPDAFKLHIERPKPDVSANNTTKRINNYDSTTMEWSDSINGPFFANEPAEGFGNTLRTVFVRVKGDSGYSGNDPLYGDYKKYVDSPLVPVSFFNQGGEGDYTLYFVPEFTTTLPGEFVYVDLMLKSTVNYWQVMADITFDPDILECDYSYLAGHVAAYQIVAPGRIRVWSFPAYNIIVGIPCNPPVHISKLKFNTTEAFANSGSPTQVTINYGQVNAPGNLKANQIPPTVIGPPAVILLPPSY
ncbi:MAG: hypothetical protein FWG43_03875 [Clostridiales bacterium]|nr:hypothetical protein [Clostridiales bacterium]